MEKIDIKDMLAMVVGLVFMLPFLIPDVFAFIMDNYVRVWFNGNLQHMEWFMYASVVCLGCLIHFVMFFIIKGFRLSTPKGLDDLYLPPTHADMQASKQKAQSELKRFIVSFNNPQTQKVVKYWGKEKEEKVKSSSKTETMQEWFVVDALESNSVRVIDHTTRLKKYFTIILSDIEDWAVIDMKKKEIQGGFSKLALYKQYLKEIGEYPQEHLKMFLDIDFENLIYR